ncbi:uncharacterized protein [Coffea arabica]|uniref:PGG domain-containing protein n=1 Tax=Coffea arabica TaxID=13443 RepID=A0A6P6U4E3_COFAR|nr:ankyrin repeat-containing protein BDA1-like isoform X2 [Coffea arabica]
MDRRLCDAALEGDVTALCQLLQEDPLALAKAALKCEDKNPLHIAAILGHVDFVKAILQVDFAYLMCLARDQDGRNPLHLAAMYGRLEILQGLLDAGSQANSAHSMCLARDRDGRNPLHLAAMYGRVAVLQVFQAALEKTDGGGTILHLCVKHNQLEALKTLVDIVKYPEFVNAKNEDGMNILHLAINYEQHETVKYILQKIGVKVNARDANGKSAVDVLRGLCNINSEIARCLKVAAAKTSDFSTGLQDLVRENRSWIQVACSIIATMAFQAAISPPGGVWQDDLIADSHGNPRRAGEAVMAHTHPQRYQLFVSSSQISFLAALSTIIITICDFTGWLALLLLSMLLHLAILALATAYFTSIHMLCPKGLKSKRSTHWTETILLEGVWAVSGILVIAVVWKRLKKETAVQLNYVGEPQPQPRDSGSAADAHGNP